MDLDIREAYEGDVAITYVQYEVSTENVFSLAGTMNIVVTNLSIEANAFSIINQLKNQGGVKFYPSSNGKVYLEISLGLDINKLAHIVAKTLDRVGCKAVVIKRK